MRKSLVIISILVLASCNMNSPEVVRQQLSKKKEQVRVLNQEIAELEEKLANDTSVNQNNGFLVPVTIKEIQPEPFNHYIEVTGKLLAENDAFVSPEMNGQIDKIHVKEGDRVNRGELLVSLNTSVTESSIKEVKTGLELATKLWEKQKELWEQKIGSELQYLEAKNAKEQAEARLATLEAQLNMARIKAPFSGEVETIFLKEGEMASPGMQVIQLVSLKSLKLYADLSEKYLGSIREGDIVSVSFPEMPDMNMKVPIHRIGNMIDDQTRTFRIEMKVPNLKEELKPNMFTNIRVNDFSSDQAFVVPSLIIKQDITGNYLYVLRDDEGKTRAEKKYVDSGLTYQDRTMIRSGLNADDRVIVEGFSQVSDGIEVVVRERKDYLTEVK